MIPGEFLRFFIIWLGHDYRIRLETFRIAADSLHPSFEGYAGLLVHYPERGMEPHSNTAYLIEVARFLPLEPSPEILMKTPNPRPCTQRNCRPSAFTLIELL